MEMSCPNCGAELVAGTNFCRQCGAAVSSVGTASTDPGSEDPTTRLNKPDSVTTQRLDPRPTSDRGREFHPQPSRRKTRRTIVAAVVSVLLVIGVLCGVFVFATRSRKHPGANAALIYPGSKTVVDMNYDDGSRALHLETADTLNAVESWYQDHLKPQKIMRLTSGSVVLKSGNTTATLVTEDNKTSILIKMTP